MKRMILGVVAAGLLSASALAADPMAGYFGNTLVGSDSKGGTSKWWYKADKTYSAVDPQGNKSSGTWAYADGQLCATQKNPAPAAGKEKNCGAVGSDKKVGDSWETKSTQGETYTLKIVAGM